MDDTRIEVQCSECKIWCPQDPAHASEDHPAWASHMLTEHPKSRIALLLDQVVLDNILDGG